MKNLSKLLFIIFLLILILPTSLSASGEPYNYRETWNSWTDYQRYIYLWGFNDAREQIWMDITSIINKFRGGKALSLYELKNVVDLTNKIAIRETSTSITDEELNFGFNQYPNLEVIRDIMTDLYKDPANTYISFKNMIFIAKDKLSGKPIEDKLIEERKSIKEAEEKMQELLTK